MFELYVFDVTKIKNSDITDGSLVKVKNLPINMILLHIWRHQGPQIDILPRALQNLSAALLTSALVCGSISPFAQLWRQWRRVTIKIAGIWPTKMYTA